MPTARRVSHVIRSRPMVQGRALESFNVNFDVSFLFAVRSSAERIGFMICSMAILPSMHDRYTLWMQAAPDPPAPF